MEILDDVEAAVAPAKLKVGDEVRYVPDMIYAKNRDAEGDYPWRIGRLGPTGKTVEEVPPHEIELFLAGMRRQAAALVHQNPDRAEEATEIVRRQTVLIEPAKTWRAVVKLIRPDGTADLDVYGANTATTLHPRSVKQDQTGKEPHTFHVA